ncbi:hypothetical protein [Hyalangium versicolor]|uniref:hypothetical protein n=1 Tax=Hyalangium versicolor TaxID=2861190 RepID=UPI001CCF4575|nr:hypothetical protein [Hyalangium versicolor]
MRVDAELLKARLPRDAFPIPRMPPTGDTPRCLTATLSGTGKEAAPGGANWKTCPKSSSAPKQPHYQVFAQLLVDCESRTTAFVFEKPLLVRPGDNDALLSDYDVWLLVSDDGASFGEVLSGCLPGGGKRLDSRVGVKQGIERIGEMCFPYYMPAPDGMMYPWQGVKDREQRQREIKVLGSAG